jgi:hypothetical protein
VKETRASRIVVGDDHGRPRTTLAVERKGTSITFLDAAALRRAQVHAGITSEERWRQFRRGGPVFLETHGRWSTGSVASGQRWCGSCFALGRRSFAPRARAVGPEWHCAGTKPITRPELLHVHNARGVNR